MHVFNINSTDTNDVNNDIWWQSIRILRSVNKSSIHHILFVTNFRLKFNDFHLPFVLCTNYLTLKCIIFSECRRFGKLILLWECDNFIEPWNKLFGSFKNWRFLSSIAHSSSVQQNWIQWWVHSDAVTSKMIWVVAFIFKQFR